MGRLAVIMTTVFATGLAWALPGDSFFNERMAVQGYLKSGATGLTTGTYAMKFIVKKNAVAVWSKTYAGGSKVPVTTGMFTQVLSGPDDTAVNLATALLEVSNNSHAITVDVIVDVDNNGVGVGVDATFSGLDIVPVPLAMMANKANNLTQMGAIAGDFLTWNNANGRWEPAAMSPTTIPNGAVGSSNLAAGAVNSAALGAGAVTAGKIAAGTIVNADVSGTAAIAYSKLNLASSLLGTDFAAGAVNTAAIGANAVTAAKIAVGTITNTEISGTAAIAYSKLNLTGAIQSTDFAAGAINSAALGAGAVGTGNFSAGAVDAAALGAGAVTAGKIAAGTIVNADVSGTAAIAYSKLNLGSSLVSGDFSAGAVNTAALGANSVTAAKIAAATITNTEVSGTAAIAYSKLNLGSSLVSGDFSAGAVNTAALGANAVTAAKIAAGTITNSEISGTAAVAYSKLNLTGALSSTDFAAGSVDLATATVTGLLPLSHGGTGALLAPAGAGEMLYSTSTTALASLPAGLAGQVLTSGAAAAPAWVTSVPVANGGTGLTSTTAGGVIYGATGSTMATSAAGTTGQYLKSNGTGAPTFASIQQAASKSQITLFEDFVVGPVMPAITAANNTVFGRALVANGAHAAGAPLLSYVTTNANRVGVLREFTGTTAGIKTFLGFCGSGAAGTITPNMRFEATDTWTFEATVALGSAAAGSGSLWIGLMSAQPAALTTQAAVPGIFFEGLSAAGMGTMTPISRGASTNTAIAGVAGLFAAATTYHTFKITSDGTTINFFIDGVNKGSTSTATDIPSTTALCPGIYHFSTATGLNIDTDYIAWTQTNGR
jgi:hypothetical protein